LNQNRIPPDSELTGFEWDAIRLCCQGRARGCKALQRDLLDLTNARMRALFIQT
jgi:hypothetical protein